ncbi:MAG: hypothetical protein JNK68_17500, partial [Betaproteobacteria bacterium]|nr:hypothetical protein [Betaproteobacteria bacterium]
AVVALAIWLPFSPWAHYLGFVTPPPLFFGILALMVPAYLALVEWVKRFSPNPAEQPRVARPAT